jgi:SAM-dependent methyltransferase
MFRMITAYWTSQALGAAARLGVPDQLADGPRASDDLARAVGADPDALYRLLRLLAMNGVFAEVAPRTFALTPLGDTLRADVPGSMRPMAAMQTSPCHWLTWGRLFDSVRTGRPVAKDALGMEVYDYYRTHPDEAVFFNAAMTSLSQLAASELLRVYDFSGARVVADVGGGHGSLLAAVLAAHPAARGILFELPEVIETAPKLDRTELVAGDFFKSVADGADVHLLKHVVHNWDDERAGVLLRNCHRALTTGGKLVLLEFVIPDDNAPSGAQPMDLNMLVHSGGRERTEAEYRRLFEATGFRLTRIVPTRGPFSVIEAERV